MNYKQISFPFSAFAKVGGESLVRLIFIVTMLVSVSCQQDETIVDTSDPNRQKSINISGRINQQYVTRVNDAGFCTGDRMGIYVVDYNDGVAGSLGDSNLRAKNVLYTYNAENDTWSSSATIYWKDSSTPVDIYGYYPGIEHIYNPLEYNFEVSYRQDIISKDGKMSNYEASDFMWCKVENMPPTEDIIRVYYSHQMAAVKVKLVGGSGFTSDTWASCEKIVQVDNTIRSAQIDLSNGVPVPYGEVDKSIVMRPQTGDIYRAVVVPQSVKAGLSLISITIDGVSYKHVLDTDMVYNMGKQHNFYIVVNKRASGDYEFEVSCGEISEWENDEASHNFEANTYVVVNVPSAGRLKNAIKELGYNPESITHLKITGELTDADFDYLHETMEQSLRSINLYDVSFVNVFFYKVWMDWYYDEETGQYREGYHSYYRDDYLPNGAFRNFENLRHIVLPNSLKHIGSYAMYGLRLVSPIILPEGLETVQEGALGGCDAEIVMPYTLNYIGTGAFNSKLLKGELILTDNITHIGGNAFMDASGLYGTFYLPQKLEFLGRNAFSGMGKDLVGDIIIPSTMTEIPDGAFGINFANGTNLFLHDAVVRIGDGAFKNVRINNNVEWPRSLKLIGTNAFNNSRMMIPELKLPSNIQHLGDGAFCSNYISGHLVLPENMSHIDATFCNTHIKTLEIGDTYISIGDKAFSSNEYLTQIYLGKNIEFIGANAFSGQSISTIVCFAPEPPALAGGAFNVYFDKCVLQVPESSVDIYRNSPGWNKFQNITAYRELAVNIPSIATLNKGVVREGIVRADGEWEVIECPDWVTVSPSEGKGKTLIEITVDSQPADAQTREGKIVFSLKGTNYTTYTDVKQYMGLVSEDDVVVLQEATNVDKPIPLFLVGDGYLAEDIESGKYLRDMQEQMEHFFSIEPLKTYRNYFTVSTAYALSQEPVGGLTRFTSGSSYEPLLVYEYARKYGVGVAGNESNSLVLVLRDIDNITVNEVVNASGLSIATLGKSPFGYPHDQRGYVLYMLAGSAFGKLGPEGVSHLTFMESCTCPKCNTLMAYIAAKSRGEWENVTMTNKLTQLPWYHLMFHEKYSSIVDVYEGACQHSRGAYRSENQSVMSDAHIHYFNTISREVIVRRIKKCAGEEFSFDDFVANDKIEFPEF